MKGTRQAILVGGAALLIFGLVAAHSAEPSNRAGFPGARILKLHGIPTLEVDGAPFLLVGAQCDVWRSTPQDAVTVAFFDGFQEMHATAVSVGVPWSKLEPKKDEYGFSFLDWFIDQARQHGLKLVVNLFNSNVCGKVGEGHGGLVYPPEYILNAPESYQRMVLPGPCKYVSEGPPMCPNDPRTLERERRLCVALAEHLARTDVQKTVIMLQIDNEFYYQQWAGPRPQAEAEVRCHCRFCEEKWPPHSWKDGEEFMFNSFADYLRVLTDAITAVHPLPLYVNSPWWPPSVIPIFLNKCPNLSLVGVDGVFSPNEPNMLSRSQIGRNIPFAAENPTENPTTRFNLDVLPYYSLVGQQGIGNLLWECSPPHTVVGDPEARKRYGNALYPLHSAQVPIAKARGTENLVGWYLLREVAANLTTDIFGNFIPAKESGRTLVKDHLFVREGLQSRIVETNRFTVTLGDLRLSISDSAAGVIVRTGPNAAILAIPKGRITAEAPRPIHISEGRFERDSWLLERERIVETVGKVSIIHVREPAVLRLLY